MVIFSAITEKECVKQRYLALDSEIIVQHYAAISAIDELLLKHYQSQLRLYVDGHYRLRALLQ